MTHTVLVINPNSSTRVTSAIDRAVNPAVGAGERHLRCVTLDDGPAGIVTQADADLAATLVATYVAAHDADADAFVIACFSDPGVVAARERTRRPVVGIGEAGMLAALSMGQSVGVVAVAQPSIPRHMRYWRMLQLDRRVAGERALDVPVDQSGDADVAFARMVETGRALRDRDDADVLLLGCAGMADLRLPLEKELGLPVVDPCQAGAALALWRARQRPH